MSRSIVQLAANQPRGHARMFPSAWNCTLDERSAFPDIEYCLLLWIFYEDFDPREGSFEAIHRSASIRWL